jgi:hypothetical protein
VKGYRLIDLSSDRLIIERNVQFKESVSHVPQQPHVDTFIFRPLRDDENAHTYSYSYEIYDSKDSYDLDTESIQSDEELVHADADVEP